MCFSWDSLHAGTSVSLVKKRRGEEKRRELVKRGTPFCTGGNRVAKPPENACVLETRTGYRGSVYCTGLLRTGLLSYVSRKEVCGIDTWEYSTVLRVRVSPTCLGTKGLKRRSYAYA